MKSNMIQRPFIVLVALTTVGTAAAQSVVADLPWRVTDWDRFHAFEGTPGEQRVGVAMSAEFFREGYSKAALMVANEPYFAFWFWPYRLVAGADCSYTDLTLTIDKGRLTSNGISSEFPLVIEVERCGLNPYVIKPLGIQFPQFAPDWSEWEESREFLDFIHGAQTVDLTAVETCEGVKEAFTLELTFSLRGLTQAMDWITE